MDNKKNYILIPCAHVCVCEECAGKVTFYFDIGNQFVKTRKEEVQVLRQGVIEEVLFVFASIRENGRIYEASHCSEYLDDLHTADVGDVG